MAVPPTNSTGVRASDARSAPNHASRSSGVGARRIVLSNSSASMLEARSESDPGEQLIFLFAPNSVLLADFAQQESAQVVVSQDPALRNTLDDWYETLENRQDLDRLRFHGLRYPVGGQRSGRRREDLKGLRPY